MTLTKNLVIGQAIFEIGRRLKWAKENDLVHGEWMKWLESKVEVTPRMAQQFISVYEEYGSNTKSISHLGVTKLIELKGINKEDREDFISQSHTIPSTGENKKVDEMTVRELREVKIKLTLILRWVKYNFLYLIYVKRTLLLSHFKLI